MRIADTGFFWILLAGIIYACIHSFFASTRVKEWVASQLGVTNPKVYHFIYVLQSLLFGLIYISLIPLLPNGWIYLIQPTWLLIIDSIIELAAIIGMVTSLIQTGIWSFVGLDAFLPSDMVKNPTQLRTHGLYALVRHPLYLFSLIFIWLFPVMTWNILAFNIGATAYSIVGSLIEERKLIQEYGQAYLDYIKRVPAFLPRLKPNK